MQNLITGLLQFSKIGQSGDYTKVNIKALIEEIEENLSAVIKTREVKIHCHNLPTINCLRTETHQLFQNLILNAIKFTNTDQTPIISINAEELANHWQFSVSDNGIGIAPENIERVFQMFQRLHTSKKYSGQGLGLAFCKKIVDLHHGKIWVDSAVGKGSTFHFTLEK